MSERICSRCKQPILPSDVKFYKLEGKRSDLATQIYLCKDCGARLDSYVREFLQEVAK